MRKILAFCIFLIHCPQLLEAAGMHFINESSSAVDFEFIFTNYVVRAGTLQPHSQVDIDAIFEGLRQVSFKRFGTQWQTISLDIPGSSGWSTIIIGDESVAINRKVFAIIP
jgi:hypothetical protein